MMSSIDGRSLTDNWNLDFASPIYEETAACFKADAWACGRVTMQEISHGKDRDYPRGLAKSPIPRTDHFAKRDASQYAISIDPKGRVAWKSNTALDSHIVEVLAESVEDDYLAYLQSIGASYVFGGKDDTELKCVVDTLARELEIGKLIVEGGGHVSGAFVNAQLADEVSVRSRDGQVAKAHLSQARFDRKTGTRRRLAALHAQGLRSRDLPAPRAASR
jgi:hypothetical protein